MKNNKIFITAFALPFILCNCSHNMKSIFDDEAINVVKEIYKTQNDPSIYVDPERFCAKQSYKKIDQLSSSGKESSNESGDYEFNCDYNQLIFNSHSKRNYPTGSSEYYSYYYYDNSKGKMVEAINNNGYKYRYETNVDSKEYAKMNSLKKLKSIISFFIKRNMVS